MSYLVSEKTRDRLSVWLQRDHGPAPARGEVTPRYAVRFKAVICGELEATEESSGTSMSLGYSWVEAQYLGGGSWQAREGGREGGFAFEWNSNPTFAGTIVELEYSQDVPGEYLFQNTSDSSGVPCDPDSSIGDSDGAETSGTSDDGTSDDGTSGGGGGDCTTETGTGFSFPTTVCVEGLPVTTTVTVDFGFPVSVTVCTT